MKRPRMKTRAVPPPARPSRTARLTAPFVLPAADPAVVLAASPLPACFYLGDTVAIAKALLGKALIVVKEGVPLAVVITEVEAYLGELDPASHAFRGETARTRSMFGPGGTCYVYLSYGMHRCVNVVTQPAGLAQAVLLRAASPLLGFETMAGHRGIVLDGSLRVARQVLSGPGKLAQALGLGLADDGRDFFGPKLRLVDLGLAPPARAIGVSARIGITKAKDEPLRFFVSGSAWLSR
jgi:DNA-3-methyladenine glycosylase